MQLHKVALGAAAMSAVNMLRLLAQFMAIPLLARHISPHDYGIIGIAMPFILLALLIADSGIGMSLVRTGQSERREWSSCFWLSVGLGVVLSSVMALLAPVVAYFYAEPALLPVVLCLSFVILAQTISLIPGTALQQAKRFGTSSAVDLAAILASIATAVVLALKGAGVWALVSQQLVLYACKLAGLLWFSPFRPAFVFDFDKVKPHLIFGRDMLASNFINFATRAADNVVIGRVQGTMPVGIYSMAFQFLRLPSMLISGPLQYVLFSQLAAYKNDRVYLAAVYKLMTRLTALVIFPFIGMISAAHEPIFDILLSKKWALSGAIFQIAAPAAALQAVMAIGSTIMLVLGRTDIQLRVVTEFAVIGITGLVVSSFFGIVWVAFTFLVLVLLYAPRQLSFVLPALDCRFHQFAEAIVVPLLATVAAFSLYEMTVPGLGLGKWAQAFIAGTLASGAALLALLLQWRQIKEAIGLVRKKV